MKTPFFFCVILLAFCTIPAFAQENDDDLVRTKSFQASLGGMLDVSVNGGDIRIQPWDKNEVHINARGGSDDDFDRLYMRAEGKTIRVQNSSGGWSDMQYDINVPSMFNLDLRTSNGNIDIVGSLTGDVRGSTSAGDIHLGNVTGKVDMNTSGGNIRTGDVQGDLTLQTSGGDVVLGTVSGEADVSTSGGNIRVDDVKKTLYARTSGGDVIIGNVGGETDVSTAGGNIRVGKVAGSAKLATAGGDIELRGANGDIRVKTSGGNIRLENITGSIDAKTAGGDVQAELIPSGKGRSRLSTAAGEIKLYVPENAKATIDARIRVQGSWRYNRDDYRIFSDFKSQSYEADQETHEIHGTYVLNGGGENITLETTNADIEIRKLVGHSK
jgi:DUF4097 and DUF4098 domain-containing protein YvlB